MNYISLNIAFSDAMQAEILTAELADYPFESFEADAGTLKAYIPQEQLADCKGEMDFGEGKKSMAFSLTLSDPAAEVSNEQVERTVKKVLGNLKFKLGIEIR